MLSYLRLNGVDLLDYTTSDGTGHRDVASVTGLVGLGAPRGESKRKTERHGNTNRGRHMDSRIISVEGEAWGTDDTACEKQWREVEAAFYATLLTDDGALLEWGIGALDLQAYVKLTGDLLPAITNPASSLPYQAQVEQLDPRAYAQVRQTAVGANLAVGGGGLVFPFTFPILFTPSTGGIAHVANLGNIETPPVVRVYAGAVAPLISPWYSLGSTGEVVKITGTVDSNSYLEIDHAKRTVKINGNALRMSLLDTPNSTFFDVPPGDDIVRLIASNFGAGAHIEVDTRDAYGG